MEASKKERYVFIDVLRGIAVFWMIETHTLDAFFYNDLKQGWLYNAINISNGFVAVAFLFCAGAGFWIQASRKLDDFRSFRPPLWKLLKRIGIIFLASYWLHMPYISIKKLLNMPYDKSLIFFQCDVLNAIAATMLISLIILMLIPKLKILPWIFGALALIIYFLTPLIWASEPISSLGTFIGAYFSHPPVSRFPLFPWSGHLFTGIAVTAFFFNSNDKIKISRLFLIAGFIISAILFYTAAIQPKYGFIEWWRNAPGHSVFRILFVTGVFGLLYLTEKYYKENRLSKILQATGQNSLFMYTFHLMIVYGSIINYGLRTFLNNSMNAFEIILVTIGVIAVCYVIGEGWKRLQSTVPDIAKSISWSLLIFFIILMFLAPAW